MSSPRNSTRGALASRQPRFRAAEAPGALAASSRGCTTRRPTASSTPPVSSPALTSKITSYGGGSRCRSRWSRARRSFSGRWWVGITTLSSGCTSANVTAAAARLGRRLARRRGAGGAHRFALQQIGGDRTVRAVGRLLVPGVEELRSELLAEIEVGAVPDLQPQPRDRPRDEANQIAAAAVCGGLRHRVAEPVVEVGLDVGMEPDELALGVGHLLHPAAPVGEVHLAQVL